MRNALHYAIIPGALLLPWLLAIPFLIPLPPQFYWAVVPFVALGAIVFLSLIRWLPVAFTAILVIGLWLLPLFLLFPLLLAPALLAIVVFRIRSSEAVPKKYIPPPPNPAAADVAVLPETVLFSRTSSPL